MRRNEAQTLLDEMVDIHKKIAVKEMEIAQLQDRLDGIREGILSAFMEEPVPNAVPVQEAPVTDLKEVKEDLRVWKNAIRVCVRNRVTQEEREFPSKNQASKFLGVSYPKMNDILLTDGTWGDWNVTMIEEPSASTPGA